jgi:hypothetical protein
MRDRAALHQVDQHRRDAGLHHVTAEHRDHSALLPRGCGDGFHHPQEILGAEHLGQGLEKIREGPLRAHRLGEIGSRHLVRTRRDGDRADLREVGLARRAPILAHGVESGTTVPTSVACAEWRKDRR